MARPIVRTDYAPDKPAGARWRRIGAPPHADYIVRWDRGRMETGHTSCKTLTDARRTARAIVREGRAWAEVLRYWEDGTRIKPCLLTSYEVEFESGSAVR